MQLATSQRPHPPPVPPRPSRQVVAEALKRSPRPPCPTRQAPPPPNTKPWRSDQQQQQQVGPAGGRTIIYESIKECVKDIKDESVSNERNQQDCKQSRNAVERNAEDNRLENGGKMVSHDQETSERLHPTGNVPVNIVRKRNSLTEDQRPRHRLEIRENSRGKDLTGLADCRYKNSPEKDQESTAAEKDEGRTAKPPVAARTVNVSHEDEERCSLSSASPDSAGGRVAVTHAEKCNSVPEREANGPTPVCGSSSGEQRQLEASPASEKSGAVVPVSSIEKSTSVASVDRAAATVHVVDEAERKIAPGDREDGNDSDGNIHRQDWLEAGIRYSSTKITLHGDDGDSDAVDGDRLNGYDHHEEERITDLDYIR